MKIVLTGGGSGGHITPIIAVAREIKRLQPDAQLIYIGQRGDQLLDVPRESKYIDEVYAVRAGKLRRYHGEGVRQIFDIPTLAKNVRDAWRTAAGIWQSYRLLGKIKPDCVFIKGGFVGVPVGLAAAKRHIPYVTHDSDALPGLANRIIARWASLHAVGLPKEVYPYPSSKTVTVGVPVQSDFHRVTPEQQIVYKKQIGQAHAGKILFVTGGGNGALTLNDAVAKFVPAMIASYPDLVVVHVTGRTHEATFTDKYDRALERSDQRERVIVKGFVTDLYAYSGAADVVLTRAGATNLAEFAIQHKACIVVPNPLLAGGHQIKNAQLLSNRNAVISVTEAQLVNDPSAMEQAVRDLLNDPKERQALGRRFGEFAKTDAATQLAMLLLKQAKT
jgi:UDP-N-acetylglucosamine--N-acetylmuramyl-(pentapeptide) pyrophosphoryl-undecaprenol N-acetylglucosamine transferase